MASPHKWKGDKRGTKMKIWGDFQSMTGVTRGGGLKDWKIVMTSFMENPLKISKRKMIIRE